MDAREPLIHWPQPIFELVSFLALFLAAGAIGFRFGVLRQALRPGSGLIAEERDVCERSAARAARFGLIGAIVTAALWVRDLPDSAARAHASLWDFVRTDAMTQIQVALLVVAIGGFLIAARRRDYGWPLAAIAVVASTLRAAFQLQWTRLVNPIHMLAAGLWIGTLFVMVAVGITGVLASRLDTERRGALVARMVYAFSPLALGSAAVLATFGVITAWRHLGQWDLLWTTPYGKALLVKLGIVGLVLLFGAWNWRRQKPRLGSEVAARSLRTTAMVELSLAALVLLVTAVLVSLPDARPPGH